MQTPEKSVTADVVPNRASETSMGAFAFDSSSRFDSLSWLSKFFEEASCGPLSEALSCSMAFF